MGRGNIVPSSQLEYVRGVEDAWSEKQLKFKICKRMEAQMKYSPIYLADLKVLGEI